MTLTPKKVAVAIGKHGTLRETVKQLRKADKTVTYYQVQKHYKVAVSEQLMEPLNERMPRREEITGKEPAGSSYKSSRRTYGTVKVKKTEKLRLPASGKVRYHLFTCAQNNTRVHHEFWTNLLAYKDFLGANLHIARITYKKESYTSQLTKDKLYRDYKEMWWDDRVVPYLDDSRLDVAPGLTWCGDVDILPTAERPLQGMESYTGRRSGIFPHTKIAMESIHSNKFEPTKFNYTTGAVTLRNYIKRKVGMKAEFHHCYSALIVAVDDAGNWYVRQLNADSTGRFYDLDRMIKNGEITTGSRAEAIYWSDGHIIEAADEMLALAFDANGLKDLLRPKMDFIGDVISFKSRSHHDMKDPHRVFLINQRKENSVKKEVGQAGEFIWRMHRDFCKSYFVYGNHERHIGRWLKEANWTIFDPTNAEYWSRLQAETFAFIRENNAEPNYFQLALEVIDMDMPKGIHFLLEDESVIVCPDANGGIECGAYHTDRGPGGKQGTPRAYSRMGRKVCGGDKHYAIIIDAYYGSGAFSDPDKVEWVHGPNNWSCTNIVIQPNGKRQMVTFWNGKFDA